jgi:transcriptional regulator with XRE-family HTH domain
MVKRKIMKLVIDYVEDAKEKLGMESDAALAKHLGGSRTLVSQWRNDGSIPDDYYCIRIGQILGIDPLIVISAANFQREKSSERKAFWENFNSGRTGKILGTALITGMLAMPSPEGAQAAVMGTYTKLIAIVYIM